MRKIMRRTSMTSTSGVVLISDIALPSSPPSDAVNAMGYTPRGGIDERRYLLLGSSSRGSGRSRSNARAGHQERMDVGSEVVQAVHDRLVATGQPVVAQHRRHSHGQTDGGHDQSFTNRTSDLVDRGLAGHADVHERAVNTDHGT